MRKAKRNDEMYLWCMAGIFFFMLFVALASDISMEKLSFVGALQFIVLMASFWVEGAQDSRQDIEEYIVAQEEHRRNDF